MTQEEKTTEQKTPEQQNSAGVPVDDTLGGRAKVMEGWDKHRATKGKQPLGGGNGSGKEPEEPEARDFSALRNAMRERREQVAAPAALPAEVQEVLNFLHDEETRLNGEAELLIAASKEEGVEIDRGLIRDQLEQIQKDLLQIKVDKRQILVQNRTAMASFTARRLVEIKTKRLTKKNLGKMDPAKVKKADEIGDIVIEAVRIGGIQAAPPAAEGEEPDFAPSFTWGKERYVAKLTESGDVDAFLSAMSDFIADYSSAREESREEYKAEVARFMIGTEKQGEKGNLSSELDLLKDADDTTRSLVRFMECGEGNRVFVPVRNDRGEGILGELLVERQKDGPPIVKRVASYRPLLAHLVFSRRSRDGDKVTWTDKVLVEEAVLSDDRIAELEREGKQVFRFKGPNVAARALTEKWSADMRHYERDLKLEDLAAKHKATLLAKENAAKFALAKGGEGVYALAAIWSRTPVGAIVKKTKAGGISCVAGTDDVVDRVLGDKAMSITSLVGNARAFVKNALRYAGMGDEEMPEHLQGHAR